MSDGPFYEVAKECDGLIAEGGTVFQKFTCEACRARQTMTVSNVLFTSGKCDECGYITDLKKTGCGFMLVASNDPEAHVEFVEGLTKAIEGAQPKNRN